MVVALAKIDIFVGLKFLVFVDVHNEFENLVFERAIVGIFDGDLIEIIK